MEYLNRLLGIHILPKHDSQIKPMPYLIHDRYDLQKVMLDSAPAILAYPKGELDSVNSIKKHFHIIETTENAPVILILNHLSTRQRNYLLREHIPFLVEGKQIYLPFMAIYLQERGDAERQDNTTMLPSAQLLLLFYIYNGCNKLLTSEAAMKLNLTATSISRASRQLEDMKLIRTEKYGVQKIIFSGQTPEELFMSAKRSVTNPIKKSVYVSKDEISNAEINEHLLLSGYSALSEYSMMNPPVVECFATNSIAKWEKRASNRLQNSDDQCEVQLWRYDPRKLAVSLGGCGCANCVDKLSLALALNDNKDERVEEAVEEMLTDLWRNL